MDTFEPNDWIEKSQDVPFNKDIVIGKNKSVIIIGEIPQNADMFRVDLCKEKDVTSASFSTIPFSLKVRFDDNTVVLNNMKNSKWSEEEKRAVNPFRKGSSFEIEILITGCEFLVSLDHIYFGRFEHRYNYKIINHLSIDGDVKLSSVQYKSCKDIHPSSVPIDAPIFRSSVLYYLINGFLKNTTVEIMGALQKGCPLDKYSINLCTNWENEPDYALHISPRLVANYVACNTKCDGKWGEEEKKCSEKGCPFVWNTDFILKISYDNGFFVVHHDGTEILKFKEQIPISKIKNLVLRNIKVSRILVRN